MLYLKFIRLWDSILGWCHPIFCLEFFQKIPHILVIQCPGDVNDFLLCVF